ncbi:MAG: DUF1559 domain-containing protein, partial [Gemmataceae bacterium]|nr:DUF1559 domain-containing protein [Gemmataceae bacterium]
GNLQGRPSEPEALRPLCPAHRMDSYIYGGTNIFALARSYHQGGVNMAMVDGSVRFVPDTIDATIYKALGSRNGGEVPGE